MSDKPLIQQSLAFDLSELLLLIHPTSVSDTDQVDAAISYLEGFWRAMVREWTGIDRYR